MYEICTIMLIFSEKIFEVENVQTPTNLTCGRGKRAESRFPNPSPRRAMYSARTLHLTLLQGVGLGFTFEKIQLRGVGAIVF